jgi:hypothetical protein
MKFVRLVQRKKMQFYHLPIVSEQLSISSDAVLCCNYSIAQFRLLVEDHIVPSRVAAVIDVTSSYMQVNACIYVLLRP